MFRIKICGVTREEDVIATIDSGADAIGFNFYPESPRYVEPSIAARLVLAAQRQAAARNLPKVTCIGVFVNASADSMRSIAHQVGLTGIQLHGDDVAQRLPEVAPFLPCLAALRVRSLEDPKIAELAAIVDQTRPSGVLVDAYSDAAYGGTGHQVAWDWLPRLKHHWAPTPTILAGGLQPDNVERAIEMAAPAGVDVASGVESTPGIKDRALIEQFVQAARRGLERPFANRNPTISDAD